MTQSEGRFNARPAKPRKAASTNTITAALMPRKAACTNGTSPHDI